MAVLFSKDAVTHQIRNSVANIKTECISYLQNYTVFKMDKNYIIIDVASLVALLVSVRWQHQLILEDLYKCLAIN